MVSDKAVAKLIAKYNINTDVIPATAIKHAIEVELEHKALIGHSVEKALIIALAHLKETPRYYQKLSQLEKAEERYWSKHVKPNIFNE